MSGCREIFAAVTPAPSRRSIKSGRRSRSSRAATELEAVYATDILVATKSDSIRFYGPILGFEQIGQPRNYPPFNLEIKNIG